jgi:hypothetical protein
MKNLLALVATVLIALPTQQAMARGGGGGHSSSHSSSHSSGTHSSSSSGSHTPHSTATPHTSAPSPGTGAKSQSTTVRGYTKKDGTYVAPYKRSTPDHNFNNNWSTKGNTNPVTGKNGTQSTPPKRKH